MTWLKPKGHTAVMADRFEAKDALDDFPTPPWATRALLRWVLPRVAFDDGVYNVWEPACGRGIMSEVLKERFQTVYASDVHDYGKGYPVGSFVGQGPDVAECPFRPHWIITNPPFKLGLEFAERALDEATTGVALLMRTAFLEGVERYEFFMRDPYRLVAPFVERVPMVKGRWDPDASTATSYSWFVWVRPAAPGHKVRLEHIPPGCRIHLTNVDDSRFCGVQGGAHNV